MKYYPAYFRTFVLLLAFGHSTIWPQLVALEGRVFDQATGQPLIGVNVTVRNLMVGDATNTDGYFNIGGLDPGPVTLFISSIGYEEAVISTSVPLPSALIIRLRETFFQMGEVVVTGTRTERVLQNVTVATEVITRQDIIDSGARDISELLEKRSGIRMQSNVEGGQTLRMMGIDSKYVLVLIDGQPVSGKFNNRISLDQLSTTAVDKIEIIKGPSSAIYGSEAMGGVINIITTRKLARSPIAVQTRFSDGSCLNNLANLDHGKRDVRLNLYRRWSKFSLQGDFDRLWANVDKDLEYIDIDDYRKFSARLNGTWEITDDQTMEVNTSWFRKDEKSHMGSFVSAATDIARDGITVQYNIARNELKFTAIGRQESYSRLFEKPLNNERNETFEINREGELDVVWSPEFMTINAGLEYGVDNYENERVGGGDNHSRKTTSSFLQAELPLGESWTLLAGTRLDNNDEIDAVLIPRVAAMFSPGSRWKFRAAWGKGFRMPSFQDRYMEFQHLQYGYRIVPNPNGVEPEQSTGYNLGLEYYHTGVYQVTVNLYRTQFTKMIDDILLEPGVFTYANIDLVDYTGLELQGRWNLSGHWLLSWGYNFVDNRNPTTGNLLANTQPHSATLRMSHQAGNKLSYSIKGKWVAPYRAEAYNPITQIYELSDDKVKPDLLLDFDGKYRVTNLLTVSAGIQNILDYVNDSYGPFTGKVCYIELDMQLKKER